MIFLYLIFGINLLLFGLAILKSMVFKSKASYKTVQKGAWLIPPSHIAKTMLIVLFLSWGSLVAFDEPWIKTTRGGGKVACFDTNDPLCVGGYIQRGSGETALVIAMGLAMMLIAILPLSEKGVIIDSRTVRKEWRFLLFKFSTKIDIENALTEKGMRGEMPILIVEDGQSGKNFTLSFPYTQQDIKFIEAEIRKRRYKMMKSKEAKTPLKSVLKKTISLKGANERANIEILKNDKEGAGN
ncbi:hypothetical protein [uncultured Campylobacter sp.]|uniref:hypothetical protein n=1 Tax=uncultured Campylobacter sp. TaxID=218934 RepID=UPI00262F5427|nr:hypothetical protein [uncultured Campylobacter sp.]